MPDFFAQLNDESLRKLARIEERRDSEAGAVLFLEEQEGTTVYRLVSGSVRLFRTAADGKEVTIHFAEPGDLFAEIVLFERDTYPVSAVVETHSVLTAIPRDRFLGLLDDPEFREDFLHNLATKIRFLSEQLYVLNTMDARERLLRYLQTRYGGRRDIRSELSKQDTAAAISVRPETLSRALKTMERDGVLSWHGDRITIHRPG